MLAAKAHNADVSGADACQIATPFMLQERALVGERTRDVDAHIGLDVTDSSPHSVLLVRDLMDVNGKLQAGQNHILAPFTIHHT